MRTRIKVMDMTPVQWDLLQVALRPEYDIPEGAVRVCVEFELGAQMESRHAEMPVRVFVRLMTQLQRAENHAGVQVGTAELPPLPPKWSAPLTPVDDGPTCDHGSVVEHETPSFFPGAGPIRTYADGCQSYGPYPPEETPLIGTSKSDQGWRDEATGLISGGLVTDES